jgi:hypothetical protein
MLSLLSLIGVDIGPIEDEVLTTGLSIIPATAMLTALSAAARVDYLAAFRRTIVQPPKKPFKPSDLAAGPWRKFTIGSRNGVGEAYAQLLQTTYFDPNGAEHASLNRLFALIVELRNRLMHVAQDFGSDPARDGFWNACRVHHYPRGGGYMMNHRDTHFPVKLGNLPFYQVMAPLSVKGRDFSDGGGIVITHQGLRLNTDEVAGLGSIVVFDGRIMHGVDDVDPREIMRFDDEAGRLAAFANLYVH